LLKNVNKKHGFTLSEILIVLGLIGAISAITIPNLAYNYKAKVLEEQFRSTYSEIKEIGSAMNYEKGDVGLYANKSGIASFAKDFISRINGANNLMQGNSSKDSSGENISDKLKKIYKEAGGAEGPYYFNLDGGKLKNSYVLCDNYNIWSDTKGRIWTFNSENSIICVDINGTANPNRQNIDIFAFVPMSAEMVATWVYDDPDHPENYSGQIVPCDIDLIASKSLSNKIPAKNAETGKYTKGTGDAQTALDACPFWEPVENVAPVNSTNPGKSARNKDVTRENNYWKEYINYK